MQAYFARDLLIILLAALAGGSIAKLFKLTPIIGYIISGIVFGKIFNLASLGFDRLAEIGAILLLFSIGLEVSLAKLEKIFKIALFGTALQIILVTIVSYGVLSFFSINPITALILSLGFSLSSTAVVVKILSERGELDTIHGEVMVGWLLAQDLAVVPMMVLISAVAKGFGGGLALSLSKALGQAALVILGTVFVGRLVTPFAIHKVASLNSRELLVITAVVLALGTAWLAAILGISPVLGAFLAGVVISESQEHHAVFAEIRPLRDLFVALFFVTLGFLVTPGTILNNVPLILAICLSVLLIKILIVFFVSVLFGYHGKTAVALSLGLAQVGEFAFIIFSSAKVLNLISEKFVSIGIAVTLITLLITPLLFKSIVPFWRKLKSLTPKIPWLDKLILGWDRKNLGQIELEGHIVICGYGRVGGWVGKALDSLEVPFVAIDYNHEVVNELKKKGANAIYGDPGEPEVLDAAGIDHAKAVIIAIPDRFAQDELIAHVQTKAPHVKIITRVHQDEDFEKLRLLNVDKIVQPEFEAAIAMSKAILTSMGKTKEEISKKIKSLRLSRAKT